MNDFIGAMNKNRWMGANLKRKETRRCAIAASILPKISKPVELRISWVECDKRRDIDNVAAGGTKVLLDGLVAAGILPDDSRRWVRAITHLFPDPDKAHPRVIVEILVIGEDDEPK